MDFIKKVTGDETIDIRDLFKSSKEFSTITKIIISSNEMPNFKTSDIALINRIIPYSFSYDFVKNPNVNNKQWMISCLDNPRLTNYLFSYWCYQSNHYIKLCTENPNFVIPSTSRMASLKLDIIKDKNPLESFAENFESYYSETDFHTNLLPKDPC